MPCHVTDEGKLKAYIAPVNHNNISEDMVVDICNIMMGDYCGSDNSHMQEMGDDAGVIVGWDELLCFTWTQRVMITWQFYYL